MPTENVEGPYAQKGSTEGRLICRRLIEFNKAYPGSSRFGVTNRFHSVSRTRLSWGKLSFFIFLFLIPWAVAYAGFFTFFNDIFSKAIVEEKHINSQNFALLAGVGGPQISGKEFAEVNTVGGSALLPDAGPAGGLADVSNENYDHGQISIYVVRSGDSLASIGKMYNVSVNTILWANNLSRGATLSVGQTLVILPVSGVQHTVKSGDTLSSIAKKYKGDLGEISSFNGFDTSATLAVGSVIIIPDGEITAVATRPATSKLVGASGPSYDGYYTAPLSGYRKTQGLHGYNGVDLASYRGAPVLASADGEVIIARSGGYNGGYGSYVVIKHGNGTQSLYAHLGGVSVSAGQTVSKGQAIGTLGNTGRSTGPHLHFEIRGARNPF